VGVGRTFFTAETVGLSADFRERHRCRVQWSRILDRDPNLVGRHSLGRRCGEKFFYPDTVHASVATPSDSSGSAHQPAKLSTRFFVALGLGFATTAVGAGLLYWAVYYELTSLCVTATGPCTPGALGSINGVLFLLGLVLTFVGLGFGFIVLASDSGRWRDG